MTEMASPTATPTRGGRRRTSRLVALAAAGAVVALGVFLWWPRTSTITMSTQPAAVTYADGSTHTAVLKRVRAPIAALGLTDTIGFAPNHYEIYLGRDPGGDYGHHLRLDATGMDPSDMTVEWTPEGAWLTFPPTGHRAFVPADSFVGGR